MTHPPSVEPPHMRGAPVGRNGRAEVGPRDVACAFPAAPAIADRHIHVVWRGRDRARVRRSMSQQLLGRVLGCNVETLETPHAGLVRSYRERGARSLLTARALMLRPASQGREALHAELRRAGEQLCKTVRVAFGLSATRTQELRTLLGGDGLDASGPLPAGGFRQRIERIAALADVASTSPDATARWLAELEQLHEATAALRDRARPRSHLRATPRRAMPKIGGV